MSTWRARRSARCWRRAAAARSSTWPRSTGWSDRQPSGYCAAKGAIVNMTRSLALEYAGCGIRVNAVCPGVILTPLIQSTLDDAGQARFADLHPMKRMGQPEEVARGVAFLAGDEASFITGVVLPVDGGYTAQ
ncbi:SDR family NAD(P)-dependent oxidoreductase [Novosphingobium resinovorum]|uniref:SDR family NAD(P)-dependent oxidoreductase n=1 Tax=Novosphingobium resinovorum TaxID=158500 RepID=UPI003D28C295